MLSFIFLYNAFAQQCPSVEISSQYNIVSEELDEISGLAWQDKDVFWMHNDSGDQSVIYQINQRGESIQQLRIPEVSARDWEDIAILKRDGETKIYIADIGDNGEKYPYYPIHIVTMQSSHSNEISSVNTIFVNYGTLGPRDAEGIAIDPTNEDIYILTKGRGGTAYLLRKKGPHLINEHQQMEILHRFVIPDIKGLNPYRFTALDISKDGTSMLWRDYQSAYLLRKNNAETWDDVFIKSNKITHPICPLALPIQPQGESISFGDKHTLIYTVSEKKHQPLYTLYLDYDIDLNEPTKNINPSIK
jgi:hypothetical protein